MKCRSSYEDLYKAIIYDTVLGRRFCCCVLTWVAYSLIGKAVMRHLSPLVSVSYSAIVGAVALFVPACFEGLFQDIRICNCHRICMVLSGRAASWPDENRFVYKFRPCFCYSLRFYYPAGANHHLTCSRDGFGHIRRLSNKQNLKLRVFSFDLRFFLYYYLLKL